MVKHFCFSLFVSLALLISKRKLLKCAKYAQMAREGRRKVVWWWVGGGDGGAVLCGATADDATNTLWTGGATSPSSTPEQ